MAAREKVGADPDNEPGERTGWSGRMRAHPAVRRLHVIASAAHEAVIQPIRRHPVLGVLYRVVIAVLGVAVIAVGIVLIPAPGPGWLVVIGGLAILATEFSWARRLLHFTRRNVQAWTRWVLRQSPSR